MEPVAKLAGPDTAQIGQTVLLDARDSVTDANQPVIWKILAVRGAVPALETADKDGRTGVIAWFTVAQPGQYLVAVVAVGSATEKDKPTRPLVDFAIKTITIVDPNPPVPPTPVPPGPQPNPTPPVPPGPAPTPLNGSIFVTALYDLNDVTPTYRFLREDATIGPTLKGIDSIWHAWDSNLPFARSTYGNVVGTKPLPLLVIHQGAKLIEAIPCPKSAAEVIAEVKRIRGLP